MSYVITTNTDRKRQLIRGMAISICTNGEVIMPPAIADECEALGLIVGGELTTETVKAIEAFGVRLPAPQPLGPNLPFFAEPQVKPGPNVFSNRLDRETP